MNAIGQPISRTEGRLKVTGAARYTADIPFAGAMDELAYETGIDPVEMRLLNDTAVDPYSGRPFSRRAMHKCLKEGAARFGWDKRTPEPRSMRDGRYLVGQGMAAAIFRWPAIITRRRVEVTGRGNISRSCV